MEAGFSLVSGFEDAEISGAYPKRQSMVLEVWLKIAGIEGEMGNADLALELVM